MVTASNFSGARAIALVIMLLSAFSALLAGMMRDWFLDNEYKGIDTYNVLPKELKL